MENGRIRQAMNAEHAKQLHRRWRILEFLFIRRVCVFGLVLHLNPHKIPSGTKLNRTFRRVTQRIKRIRN